MTQKSEHILLAYDSIRLDKPEIVVENKRFLKMRATISKVGVYKYDDGMALKSAPELMKATRTARYAKLALLDHPETKVIMSQSQLFGGVEKPFFDRNKIRAILSFDKEFVPEETLKKVRNGDLKDVSIGFYYQADWTPGWHSDVNTGKPKHYDYVMRDIVIDHVVGGVGPGMEGRCRYPQCGIGVDTALKNVCVGQDKVVKRGDKWCVIHCTGPDAGKPIKCFSGPDAKNRAEAMHRAIQAHKGKSTVDVYVSMVTLGVDITKLDDKDYKLFFGEDAERPPKAWMDACMSKAAGFADEPGAFCNWLYNNGPEKLKRSMGSSQVSSNGGIGMSQEEKTEYEKCLIEKKEEGMTDEEAAEACKDLKTDQEKSQSAYDECIAAKKAEGMSQEDAEKACEVLKPTAEDQELTPWQKCIQKHMAEGLTKEQARMKCKEEGVKQPSADQETVAEPVEHEQPLPTELEICIANRMEAHGEDEATAKKWCEDELAGVHQSAEAIVDNIGRLKATETRLNKRRRR